MKYTVLVLISLFSLNSFAGLPWSELEENQTYKIENVITIGDGEQKVTLAKNSTYKLDEIIPLSMINVMLLMFKVEACEDKSLETEMTLVGIKQPNGIKIEAGFTHVEDCMLEVYIETREYNYLSNLL